jgi:hypothetical protein
LTPLTPPLNSTVIGLVSGKRKTNNRPATLMIFDLVFVVVLLAENVSSLGA